MAANRRMTPGIGPSVQPPKGGRRSTLVSRQLAALGRTMTNEWEDVDIRAKALIRVESLGAAGRPALLYVVAALNDSDREIRRLVPRILPQLCPNPRDYAALRDPAVER